jgi:D-alanyl-D-alanine carboxypeptidase
LVSEVASLTKIMTYYTVIKIAESLSIDISSTTVTVSDKVLSITGTSADLLEGEEYSVL